MIVHEDVAIDSEIINNTGRACLICSKDVKRMLFENSHFGGVYFCVNRECNRSGVLTIATKKSIGEEALIEEVV